MKEVAETLRNWVPAELHAIDWVFLGILFVLGIYLLVAIFRHRKLRKQREAAVAAALEETRCKVALPDPRDWQEPRDSRAPWTPE
jgi:hypothetical protein